MIQVGLVGAGRIGAVHAANVAGHGALRLAAVADSDEAAAGRVAASTGARLTSFEAILADSAIAGVIIASPTGQHIEQAVAAVAAGKAVLLEKPLDLDLARARSAAGILAAAPLLVGFNRRFDPHFAQLKANAAGDVGPLQSLHITSHDPYPPSDAYARVSGGLFVDMAIHDFDMARWLLAEEATEVFAVASRLLGVDDAVGDVAKTVLRTASGRLAVISNSRRSGCGYDQRIEAFGDGGVLSVGNLTVDTVETWSAAGRAAAPLESFFLERYASAYRAEIDHFAEILAGEARPLVTYADGLAALALAAAAGESARRGVPIRP